MPRRKRNEMARIATAPAPAAAVPPESAPTRHAVRVRVTCPCCGMLPEVERFLSSPYAPEVRIQRFGGSFPATEERPMVGFMRYDFGSPEQLVDTLGLFLLVSEEARQAVLELLPDAYRDAGLDVPPEVEAGDLARILESLPSKEVLLERLLAEDTLWRLNRAG